VVDGGWVGGNAWFGSTIMAVELKKCLRLRLNSMFIIENTSTFYPTKALHTILRSLFGDKAARYWVVMTTTITCVKLTALAYTWSQRGIYYFLSTYVNTVPLSLMYQINFEDEFGNVDFKMSP
jgi:hypothetical protein